MSHPTDKADWHNARRRSTLARMNVWAKRHEAPFAGTMEMTVYIPPGITHFTYTVGGGDSGGSGKNETDLEEGR